MLSARLQQIYDLLLPGRDVWDLCCDHGYLGIVAHKSRRFSRVHFVDRAQHLVESLRARWQQENNTFFYPQPVEDLEPVLEGNIVLAGVGGLAMLSILQRLEQRGRLRAQRIILAPQRDEARLLDVLQSQWPRYKLDQSLKVQEGPRVRQIFVLNLKNDFRVD